MRCLRFLRTLAGCISKKWQMDSPDYGIKNTMERVQNRCARRFVMEI